MGSWDARLYAAFLTPEAREFAAWRSALPTIDDPLSAEEEAALPLLLRSKAPGLSQFKLAFIAGAPRALADLLQLCLSHGHCSPDAVPRALKLVARLGLAKPEGGFRFVALLEELGKFLESLPWRRVQRLIHAFREIPLLSASNRAYRPGRRSRTSCGICSPGRTWPG